MKRFTSLLLLLWVALGTFASGFESNNIYYIITDESRKTVEVSGGSNDLHYKEKDVVIPSEVIYNGTSYTVTRIGNDAFNQWNLTGIKIPNSVESIGDNAFCNCLNLTTITIPNSVKTIGRRAFGATGLVSVYIPSNVTSISTEAFAPCFYIESITVASDNPVYDSRNNCNAIIQTSNNTLIQGCQNTIIPDDITQLSDGAFVGSLITSVTIPQSIVNIGTDVFAMCPLLTSMSVAEGNPVFDSRENCNAIIHTSTNTLIQGCTGSTIPNSITSIGDRAFISRLLESITIPESVVSIGESAFSSCIDLKSIDIPNNVKSIGSYAFSSCSELKTVKIGSGVKIIPYSVFSYCYELTDVIIAEGVERIESHAFSGNSQLTNITIPKSVTYIDSEALTWTPWHTAYINNPDNCYGNIVYINDIAYKAVNRDITSCVFKNSTITISPEAFGGCTKLTSVTIPEKVTCIPNSTFDGCIYEA